MGCIPSKALLESSERFIEACTGFSRHGVMCTGVQLDLQRLLAHKDGVVDELGRGTDFLFGKHKITRLLGTGRLGGPGRVVVQEATSGAERAIAARSVILATGSAPSIVPGVQVDERQIVSSTGALSFGQVPQHLVVIGGGYIGLEPGSVWARPFAKVTVAEYLDRITPGLDVEMAELLFKILQKSGFEFMLGIKVTGARTSGEGLEVDVASVAKDQTVKSPLSCDAILVAVGRKPHADGLGLDSVGLKTDACGFIPVDLASFGTAVPGVSAIGDVIGGAMLAHRVSEEGIALMEMLAGQKPRVNYNTIPSVIYTAPEVASVG